MNTFQENSYHYSKLKGYLNRMGLRDPEFNGEESNRHWHNVSASFNGTQQDLLTRVGNSVKLDRDTSVINNPKEVYGYADGSVTVVFGNLKANVKIDYAEKAEADNIVQLPTPAKPVAAAKAPRFANGS